MSKQTQGSLALVGAIASGIFLVAFVALMVVGAQDFSTALFLAVAVAGAAAVFLFVAFHRPPATVAHRAEAPRAAATAPVAKAAAPAPAASGSGEPVKPVGMSRPQGDADDLKKIKGVGPKLEQLLHSMGYYHYTQIAGWTPAEVAWVDDNLEGFKGRVSRDDWVEQARLLATGGETEFSKRVEDGDVY
jgi:NADH-quinone oxidoreductase subunit E